MNAVKTNVWSRVEVLAGVLACLGLTGAAYAADANAPAGLQVRPRPVEEKFVSTPLSPAVSPEKALAEEILKSTGVRGGLVIHVGCGDGHLTAALYASGSFVVQGLECDEGKLAASRSHLSSLGLYGKVSCSEWDGKSLPYTDNMVNLLVVEDRRDLADAEITRALAPRGIAYIKEAGTWRKTVKPWPDDIDEWTHYLHGADRNAVAKDSRVGLPRSMQWTAGPRFLRTHNGDTGFSAMVTSNGRVFYIIDEGPIGFVDKRLPAKWALVARDAFNGALLWKRRITDWGWQSRLRFNRNRLASPATVTELLVASGDTVYVTPGIHEPVTEIDAATGKTRRILEKTECTAAILYHQGILLLERQPSLADPLVKYADAMREKGEILAVEVETGKKLWSRKIDVIMPSSVTAARDYVVYHDMLQIICLDLKTGKVRWQMPNEQKTGAAIVATPDVILTAGRDNLQAWSAADGSMLWRGDPNKEVRGPCGALPDVFVVKDIAWVGESPVGYDLRTGRIVRQIDASLIISHGHHARCYRDKATEKFILAAKRGIEFFDLNGDNHARNDWVRGPCRYGIMPANGLIYAPPQQCICYPESLMLGLNALSTARSPSPGAADDIQRRLKKGPAYGIAVAGKDDDTEDWPVYRHDVRRSGSVRTVVPEEMAIKWKKPLTGKTSAPVCVDGRLYISLPDSHQVVCLDAKDGKTLWTVFAGARVDTPPTIHAGMAFFGSADGWVYCVKADDGALAWKFRAAPEDRMIGAYDQLESPWPVHGSLPVVDNVVYCLAGRSSFLDGGIYLYGLDAGTGKVLYSNKLEGPYQGPSGGLEANQGKGDVFGTEGAKEDILVFQDGYFYLRNRKFDRKLVEIKVQNSSPACDRVIGLHLAANSSLLDDSGFARQKWSYTRRWPGCYPVILAPKIGQLIAFDADTAYVVNLYTIDGDHGEGYRHNDGSMLLADAIDNEPTVPAGSIELARGFFGLFKGHGMVRARAEKWSNYHPIWIRAMTATKDKLIIAGPPDEVPFDDPLIAFEGRNGALLRILSKSDGKVLREYKLDSPPAFDGMIAARGAIYISTADGSIVCMGAK